MVSEDGFQLLERIRHGDRNAFEEIYQRHYQELCRFAMFILHDYEQAEEVVDDVMFYLWDHREELSIMSLRSWLLKAVRNRSINALNSLAFRKQRNTDSLSDGDRAEFLSSLFDDNHPLEQMISEEMEQEINDAIKALPEDTRRVFMLCRMEGKKYAEAAAELGISVNTVKYHIKNANRILSQTLSKYLLILLLQNIFVLYG